MDEAVNLPLAELFLATGFLLLALSVWWFIKTRCFKKDLGYDDHTSEIKENSRKATHHLISERNNKINKSSLKKAQERRKRFYDDDEGNDLFETMLDVMESKGSDDDFYSEDYKKIMQMTEEDKAKVRKQETEEKSNLKPERWEDQEKKGYSWREDTVKEDKTPEPERRVNVTLNEPVETPKSTVVTPEPSQTLSVTSDKSDYTPSSGGDSSSDPND